MLGWASLCRIAAMRPFVQPAVAASNSALSIPCKASRSRCAFITFTIPLRSTRMAPALMARAL